MIITDSSIFWQGRAPVDILMVSRGGRPSGEAFVVLSSLEDVEAGLSKNRGYMGPRYIEVFRAEKIVRFVERSSLHALVAPG